jgi:hypothetical protein
LLVAALLCLQLFVVCARGDLLVFFCSRCCCVCYLLRRVGRRMFLYELCCSFGCAVVQCCVLWSCLPRAFLHPATGAVILGRPLAGRRGRSSQKTFLVRCLQEQSQGQCVSSDFPRALPQCPSVGDQVGGCNTEAACLGLGRQSSVLVCSGEIGPVVASGASGLRRGALCQEQWCQCLP